VHLLTGRRTWYGWTLYLLRLCLRLTIYQDCPTYLHTLHFNRSNRFKVMGGPDRNPLHRTGRVSCSGSASALCPLCFSCLARHYLYEKMLTRLPMSLRLHTPYDSIIGNPLGPSEAIQRQFHRDRRRKKGPKASVLGCRGPSTLQEDTRSRKFKPPNPAAGIYFSTGEAPPHARP